MSLATSLLRSWSIWMICSSVSVILPLACATAAISCARSPSSRAASRSSAVSRVICTRLFFQSSRTPSSSLPIRRISRSLASCWAVRPPISSCSWVMRWRSCAFCPSRAVAAQLEQLAFVGECNGDGRVVGAGEQHARERDRFGPVTLGFEPRLARGELVEAFGDDGKVGARDRVVEPHEDIAGLDAIAVVHAELADDAAGRVLHLLDVGIDDDRARRDQRAGDLGRCRPAADAAGEQQHDQAAGQEMTMDGVARASRRGRGHQLRSPFFKALADDMNELRDLHAPALPLSGTTLSGRGPGAAAAALWPGPRLSGR